MQPPTQHPCQLKTRVVTVRRLRAEHLAASGIETVGGRSHMGHLFPSIFSPVQNTHGTRPIFTTNFGRPSELPKKRGLLLKSSVNQRHEDENRIFTHRITIQIRMMGVDDLEVLVADKGISTRPKSPPLRRRNSPKSPDADVALYDVANNRFQTVKKRDAESLSHQYSSCPI